MFKHLTTSALFAGLAAGALAALLHVTFLAPLLLEGELYETGERVHFAAGSAQSMAGAPDIWGHIPRHIGTFAADMVTFTGFAFVLVALFALVERGGHQIEARHGVLWGAAGFVAVQLAPAFGLPPELPGTISADLGLRQLWWTGTIAATAGALGLFAFGRGPAAMAAGVVLLVAPHLIGAPHLDTYFGAAPPELAAHFVSRSLAVSAACWAVLGIVATRLWARRG